MVKGFHDCMCFYYISSAFVGVSTFFLSYPDSYIMLVLHVLLCIYLYLNLLIWHVPLLRLAHYFFYFYQEEFISIYIFKKNHNLYTRRILSRHLPGILYMKLLFCAFIFLHIAYNHIFYCNVLFVFNGRAILSIFKILWGKLNSTSQISKCFIILYIVYIIRKEYWLCFLKYTIKIMKKELLLYSICCWNLCVNNSCVLHVSLCDQFKGNNTTKNTIQWKCIVRLTDRYINKSNFCVFSPPQCYDFHNVVQKLYANCKY